HRGGRSLGVVFELAHVLSGDRRAQMRDRKAGAGARGDLAWGPRAEPSADEPGDGLAQRLVGIPGDSDRLRVKIVGQVDGGAHRTIITSAHHDAVMREIVSSCSAVAASLGPGNMDARTARIGTCRHFSISGPRTGWRPARATATR